MFYRQASSEWNILTVSALLLTLIFISPVVFAYGQISNGNQQMTVQIPPGQSTIVNGFFWVKNNPNGGSSYTNVTIVAGNVSKIQGDSLINTGIPVTVSQSRLVLTASQTQRIDFSFPLSQVGTYEPEITVTFRNPGESLPSPGPVSITVFATNGTASQAASISRDVDGDNRPEQAIDSDNQLSNGYEVYQDPDSSSQALKVDGDADGKADFLIDTNKDGSYENYWDVDNSFVTTAFSAGSGILLVDTNNDGIPDKKFASNQFSALARLDADIDNDGDTDTVFDLNGNSQRDSQDRVWDGSLFTLPDIQIDSITLQATYQKGPNTANVAFRNLGTYPATSFTIQFFVDGSLVQSTLQTLSANQQRSVPFTFTGTADTHTLKAVLDPQDFVKESNEQNNQLQSVTSSTQIQSPPAQNQTQGTVQQQQTQQPAQQTTQAAGSGSTSSGSAGSGSGSGIVDSHSSDSSDDNNGGAVTIGGNSAGQQGDQPEITLEDDSPTQQAVTGSVSADNSGTIIAGVLAVAIIGGIALFKLFIK